MSQEIKGMKVLDEVYELADSKARERLEAVEYQTITTEEAYEHKDLPEGEKTVTINSNGSWGDKTYVCTGEDLVPRKTFSKSFPYNGITITKENSIYHITGTSTATTTIYLGDADGNTRIGKVKDLNGQTLKLVTFADKILGSNIRVQYQFYGADGVSLASAVKKPIASNTTSSLADIVVPNGAEYMTMALLLLNGITFDDRIQLYLSLANNFSEDIVVGDDITIVMTMPYPSVVSVSVPLNQYIEHLVNNTKPNERPVVNGSVTYLTPEDFGAVGDNVTDDSAAIEACLTRAGSARHMVIMAKKYYVSTPIKISQQGLYLLINDIKYDGNESAVVITGKRNTIKIHSITSASTALTFGGAEASSSIMYNDVEINNISSGLHGIVFDAETASMYQNTVKFNSISANGNGCYGIAYLKSSESITTLGENNFYGGQISNCEWAVYRCGGNSKFYGIHIEDEVQGGFYIETGCAIFHPRIAESMRDGNLPIYKFVNPTHTTIYDSTGIYINQIDLSDAEEVDNTKGYPITEYTCGAINGRVISSNITDGSNVGAASVYSAKTYIWGKYLIFTPFMAYKKVVTTDRLDTRLIGNESSHNEIAALSQLPTKFVVDNINSEIYLHPSYCAFGFNAFEVEQANGNACKVYDAKGTLLFDGTEKGDGLYKFKVYKDSTYCADNTAGALRYDFLGHYWEVIKSGDTVI